MKSIEELHREAFVLDSHCDTPSRILDGNDLGRRLPDGHIDIPRLIEGGVDAEFFAIYTSNRLEPDAATRRALQMLAHTYDFLDKYRGKVALATSPEQARYYKSKGIISIFLGMENGLPFQKDLSVLRLFYRMGIRYVTLTHAGNNDICDSCATKVKKWNGVSPFGRKVIKEMNDLGMIIDCSHISDDAFYDVLKYSKAPVVATHSCCRALTNHPRNMTDQMIKDLAANGGVIQINFYPAFIDLEYGNVLAPYSDIYDAAEQAWRAHPTSKKLLQAKRDAQNEIYKIATKPSYKRLVDHIMHAVELVGPQYVGLGSDFDGIEDSPAGLDDVSKMPVITTELRERGLSDDEIKMILGENFLRVFSKVESIKCK